MSEDGDGGASSVEDTGSDGADYSSDDSASEDTSSADSSFDTAIDVGGDDTISADVS